MDSEINKKFIDGLKDIVEDRFNTSGFYSYFQRMMRNSLQWMVDNDKITSRLGNKIIRNYNSELGDLTRHTKEDFTKWLDTISKDVFKIKLEESIKIDYPMRRNSDDMEITEVLKDPNDNVEYFNIIYNKSPYLKGQVYCNVIFKIKDCDRKYYRFSVVPVAGHSKDYDYVYEGMDSHYNFRGTKKDFKKFIYDELLHDLCISEKEMKPITREKANKLFEKVLEENGYILLKEDSEDEKIKNPKEVFEALKEFFIKHEDHFNNRWRTFIRDCKQKTSYLGSLTTQIRDIINDNNLDQILKANKPEGSDFSIFDKIVEKAFKEACKDYPHYTAHEKVQETISLINRINSESPAWEEQSISGYDSCCSAKYIPPEKFERIKDFARDLGVKKVEKTGKNYYGEIAMISLHFNDD